MHHETFRMQWLPVALVANEELLFCDWYVTCGTYVCVFFAWPGDIIFHVLVTMNGHAVTVMVVGSQALAEFTNISAYQEIMDKATMARNHGNGNDGNVFFR